MAGKDLNARSIYVKNVNYACTPEEVQQHFETCGTVKEVTILTKKSGRTKGLAYVEFVEVEAAQNAVLQDGSMLRDQRLKVFGGRPPNMLFCHHCGKGYEKSAMMHHNRSVHPKWFYSKKAGKCTFCWTLFGTKAEASSHEAEFHPFVLDGWMDE